MKSGVEASVDVSVIASLPAVACQEPAVPKINPASPISGPSVYITSFFIWNDASPEEELLIPSHGIL